MPQRRNGGQSCFTSEIYVCGYRQQLAAENVQNSWRQCHAWELLAISAENEIICRLTGMVMSFQNITPDTTMLLVMLLLLEERLFGI